jgi:Putative MetA-pathway of phenol degradation
VQRLLGPGLTGIPGLGFKRFESETNEGLGDMEAGARYQYWRSEDWRLAFTGGVRFPTGKADDPDDLADYALGTGAWALLFRLNNDYVVSNLWGGPQPAGSPGELVLNGTFRYDLVLPDHPTKRVPDDVNNPITANKEKVSRDIGDKFELEVSARYALPRGFGLSAMYRYGFKLDDQVSGHRGFAYQSLENETARTEHIYILGVSYSTVDLYRDKAFPVPITLTLSYRNRFAGSNNALRSQFIGLYLQVYF